MKIQNKEVSRWMRHTIHGITNKRFARDISSNILFKSISDGNNFLTFTPGPSAVKQFAE
jgi:hypothetical protein